MSRQSYSKSKTFYRGLAAFVFGAGAGHFLPIGIIAVDLVWFGCALFFLALFFFFENKARKALALAGLFLFVGAWRYSLALPAAGPEEISYYNGKEIILTGVIKDDPERGSGSQKIVMAAEKTADASSGRTLAARGRVLIITGLYPAHAYGDKVEARCRLEEPENFNGFDYKAYLAKDGIHSLCYYPKELNLISSGNGNVIYAKILAVKNKFREIINASLSEPEASLAAAMMLGADDSIPDDVSDDFSRSGLSHIMAISGMNISFLAAFFAAIFFAAGARRSLVFYFSTAASVLYIIAIGAPASAVRAGVMVFLAMLSIHLGRPGGILNSLLLAAALMIFANPLILFGDVGFQLSFLAVLGIIVFYPPLFRLFAKIKSHANFFNKILQGIAGVLAVTIAAQILILPIIAVDFGRISLISPLANLLALWALPFIMIFAAVGLALGLFIPWPALLFAPAKLFIDYMLFIAHISARAPFACPEIKGGLSDVFMILFYLAAAAAAWRLSLNKNTLY